MLNPNEAPEGYIAVEFKGCRECAFNFNSKICKSPPCARSERSDKSSVHFIRKYNAKNTIRFNNELLQRIAEDCNFSLDRESIEEIELFASKVFEAGVEFGKQQVEKEIN